MLRKEIKKENRKTELCHKKRKFEDIGRRRETIFVFDDKDTGTTCSVHSDRYFQCGTTSKFPVKNDEKI
jgi:hypothetical protein